MIGAGMGPISSIKLSSVRPRTYFMTKYTKSDVCLTA